MTKAQAYNLAKQLAQELGVKLSILSSIWRSSTKQFWITTIKIYQKEIGRRNVLFAKAQQLANDLRKPLPVANPQGTRHKFWKNTLQRLRMFRLRQTRGKQQIQRALMVQVADQIRQRELENAERVLRTNGVVEIKVLRTGDRMLKITHKIPESISMNITEDNIPAIRQQLLEVVIANQARIGVNRFRIGIKDGRRNIDNYMSNTYQADAPIDVVNDLIERHIGPYARGFDSGQDQGGFKIEEIIIYIFEPVAPIFGHSTRTIAQATKTWYMVSPKTKFNCLFQSLAVCKNFVHNKKLLEITNDGHQARVNSGKKLKIKVKPTKDNYADYKSIQEACDWLRYPIILYNNVYEKVKTFQPKNPLKRYKGLQAYEIQVVGIHCNALVRRKDINSNYPDFVFPELGKVEEIEKNENDDVIQKRRYYHDYNPKFCAWDIETTPDLNGNHIPYACSIAWFKYQYGNSIKIKKRVKKKDVWVEKEFEKPNIIGRELKEQQFWGLDCLQRMTKFIFDNKNIFNEYTLYAHNGGKYDLPLIIKKAFLDSPDFIIEGKGCVELNNAWIGFTLRAREDRKFKLYFRDSFRLLPMSLAKITEELKVEHQKLHETINHDDINLINYNSFPQLKTYLTHDVFGLMEVIEKFGKGVWDDLGIDITSCYTGASLSKINFFKNYYNDKKHPVYKLSDDNDKFIRNSYFGGRVECHKMGKIQKAYYYDFTSLYPDVGRKFLPYGEPKMIKINSDKLPEGFFGWVRCKVKTKNKKAVPKHAILNNSRLIFPICENWTEMNLFSEELDYDIYDYQFIEGVKFEKAKFKKKFFNDGFIKKAKSKANGNPAMAQAYKIIINSGYGFWGLRTKDRDGVIIFEPNDNSYRKYLDTDKLLSIREHNDYVFCRVMKDLDVEDFNVAVASAISSYARSKLHSLITAIRGVGGLVYYMDTDSVICSINLNDHMDIKRKFQWDGDGSELGSLKNECDEVVEKLLKKLYPDKNENDEYIIGNKQLRDFIFKKLVEKENGNLSFDEGIITGCKQYALKKQFEIDDEIHNVEIVKLKGYSQRDDKLKFNDMLHINEGKNKIQQEQTQFICPKSNYVSDTRAFNIKSKKITKSFRRCYTKGQVFKDWVLPLRV